MSSLLAKYKKEREGKEMIETDHGFAIYFFHGDFCYLEDIFVDVNFRQEGVATRLADQVATIAKEKGYRKMLGSVNTDTANVTTSLRVLLAYGMRFHAVEGHMLFFMKEI